MYTNTAVKFHYNYTQYNCSLHNTTAAKQHNHWQGIFIIQSLLFC